MLTSIPFLGGGLPSFKPVQTTIDTVARLIRWQAACIDGSWDEQEIALLAEIARTKFIVKELNLEEELEIFPNSYTPLTPCVDNYSLAEKGKRLMMRHDAKNGSVKLFVAAKNELFGGWVIGIFE